MNTPHPDMKYTLQTTAGKNTFAVLAMTDFHGAPTYDQHRIMTALTSALEAGLFYNTDVYAHAREQLLDLVPQHVHDSYEGKNEGGVFGMDFYYARQTVEARLEHYANLIAYRAIEALSPLKVGDAFKKFTFSHHTFSTVVVRGLEPHNGVILFEGRKRGSASRHQFALGANDPRLLSRLAPFDVKGDSATTTGSTIVIKIGGSRNLFPLVSLPAAA